MINKQLKSSFFLTILVLLAGAVLNVVNFTTPTFAGANNGVTNGCWDTSGDRCRYLVLYLPSGSVLREKRFILPDNASTSLEYTYEITWSGTAIIVIKSGDTTLYEYSATSNGFGLSQYPNKVAIYSNDNVTLLSTTDLNVQSIIQGGTIQGTLSLVEASNNDGGNDTSGDTSTTTGAGSQTLEVTCDADGKNCTSKFPSEACSQASGGLGWIGCTAVQAMAEGSNGLMSWVEGSLRLEPELFSADATSSATYGIWGFFRDMGNLLLGAVLLVVILSQVTGYGIDNYGVKKMLPRIVVIGILLNISFYLCQLVVDVSNIIGSSLGAELDSIARTVAERTGNHSTGLAETWVVGILYLLGAGAGTVAVTGLGAATMLFSVTGAISAWPFVVAAVMVAVIVLITVLTFFFTVAARKVLAMLVVVVSPVALLCYIFPNTEKIAKRWVDIFKAVVVVYPICAALQGLSSMIQVLTFQNGATTVGVMGLLVYAVAPMIPLLSAPALISSSLKGLGNLSAMIQRVSHGAVNGVRTATSTAIRARAGNRAYQEMLAGRTAERLKSRTSDSAAPNRADYRSDRAFAHAKSRYDRLRRRATSATMLLDQADAARQNMGYVLSEGYRENRQRGREEAERLKREGDIRAGIVQVDTINLAGLGDRSYARGSDWRGMLKDLIDLSSRTNLTEQERDVQGALFTQIASTKDGIKALNRVFRGGETYEGSNIRASQAAISSMNNLRLQNGSVAASLAASDKATTIYLSDLATGNARTDADRNVDWSHYAGTALTDLSDVAAQSTDTLRNYAGMLSRERLYSMVNNPNFEHIVTDVDKQRVLREALANNREEVREGSAEAQDIASAAAEQAAARVAADEQAARDAVAQQTRDNTQQILQVMHGNSGPESGRNSGGAQPS